MTKAWTVFDEGPYPADYNAVDKLYVKGNKISKKDNGGDLILKFFRPSDKSIIYRRLIGFASRFISEPIGLLI